MDIFFNLINYASPVLSLICLIYIALMVTIIALKK